jgi:hypothetical protein
MTTSHAVIHFPYSSIEFIADANQCQHLSDECIKYLTLESTNIVRTFLHVSGKKPNIFVNFCLYRMH